LNINKKSPGSDLERSARIKADFSLLSVTLIWGFAFVVQRYAAPQVGVFLFNGLRFTLGALALVPVVFVHQSKGSGLPGINRKNIGYVILAGCLLFAGAALQQAGLIYTTAGNAGFITGLYVIFVPLIMALVLHQKPRPVIWIAAGMAVTGLYLLSASGSMQPNIGDGYVLISSLIWSLHVILTGWLVVRMDVKQFAIGQYLFCALFSVIVSLSIGGKTLVDMRGAWWAIIFTGVVSVAIGYTLLASAQRIAPPSDTAIILSIEAVFAALFGWLLLDEYLTSIQILGCGIILSGMLLSQSHLLRKESHA